MFNRLGLVAICTLLVALFAALPMGLMTGRAIQKNVKPPVRACLAN
jgi:hypothetical protein